MVLPLCYLREKKHNISFFENSMILICINLCPIHPWMLFAKFGSIWQSRLLNSVTEFTLFHYHLPLKKCLAVHLNKLELPSSSWILPLKKGMALHLFKLQFPSPKNALCKVWLKLAQWFWSNR